MPKISNVEHKAPMLSDGGGFSRHDLSHFYGFKCSTGHVVPVYADILNPNERVDIKIDRHVRLQPMVTPAFMDLECQIDYFFIPMTMLLQDFERQFSNTKEYFSRLINNAGNRNLPLFSGAVYNGPTDINLLRSRSGNDIEPFLGNDVNTIVTDNLPTYEDNGNRILRLFDYLGLDLPLCWNNVVPVPTDSQGRSIDVVDDNGNVISDSLRYLQGTMYRPSFPWKILAYNCIWQHFYRLDDFLEFDNKFFNIDGITATAHNADDFMVGSTVPTNVAEFCSIKYAPRSQDYFTSSVNSPVVQGMNILANVLPQNSQWLTGNSIFYDAPANYSANDSTPGNLLDGSVGSAALNNGSYTLGLQTMSLARLRLVKAQEKLLQIYGRLPKKNYDTFVHALFGQKVPHDVKHEISHLGKQVFKVGVKAIYSAASTSGAELGELAGAGEGSDAGRHIKFTAPVHGIIMATQFIRPSYMYAGGFLRENSITSYNDFFLPMFDNLGRQPIYGFEFGTFLSLRTSIAGWQFRWQEWKSKVNRVSRAFQFGNERSWFVVQDQANGMISDTSAGISISNAFRYVSPSALDDIMVQQFETHFKFGWLTSQDYNIGKRWKDVVNYFTNPALVFSTDPFICLNRVKSSKFSKMSRYSLQTID